MSNFDFYIAQIVSGVATGCIYGLLALGMVFIYRTTTVGNFAQAEQGTSSAYFMFVLLPIVPTFLALFFSLTASFLIGALIHLWIMRAIRHRSTQNVELSELILTVGLMTIINGMNRWIFGSKLNPFPSLFGEKLFSIGPTNISSISIGIILGSTLISIILMLFFKYTRYGINSEAVASNRLGAAARGIHIHRYMALSWGLSGVLSGVAAILAGPLLNLHPNMMSGAFISAFVAAVLGGLKNPIGSVVSGVLVGVTENLAATIPGIGSELRSVVVFSLMLIVLFIRPTGLFGKTDTRKV